MDKHTHSLPPNAVNALMELFWRRGYANSSMEEVVRATGLNRYALYNASGGKRELFLTALDAYYNERKAVFIGNLNRPSGAPLDAIRKVFEFIIFEMADRGTGCLMCNVANDLGPSDPLVAARIAGYLDEMRGAYQHALTEAQSRAELNVSITPADGAAMLIALTLGLGVLAKQGASAAMMIATFDSSMRAIQRAQIQ